MAKIKLIIKTDSNINELKRKEIQSIDWDSFPFSEQMQFIDANTYGKLNAIGRDRVDSNIPDYNSKPIEFWNVVSSFNSMTLAERLWKLATLQTKGEMLKNHAEWFLPFRTLYEYEVGQFSNTDVITSFIRTKGNGFQYDKDGYFFLADPRISLDEFKAPFEIDNEKYPSLLHYIHSSLKDDWELDEYPVLVHNHMLKSAGYTPICDLSPSFLQRHDACRHGRMVAETWIRNVTNGEKDFITWDDAVNFIRSNPNSFNDHQMMDYLEWWWQHSVNYGE